MGYDTRVDMDIAIKKDCRKEYVKRFQKAMKGNDDLADFCDSLNQEDKANTEGESVNFNDCSRNLDGIDAFAEMIQDLVDIGDIYGNGDESDDLWRIQFKDGKWIHQQAEIVYEDTFTYFMNNEGKDLPADLKKRLKEWKIAKEL